MKCKKCKKGTYVWVPNRLQLVREDGLTVGRFICNKCGFSHPKKVMSDGKEI